MTCIVALKTDRGVMIGGDSAGVAGYSMTVRADTKVFNKGGMVFGFAGSFRGGQLIRHALKIPLHDPNTDTHAYLCTTFVDALRELFEAKGHGGRFFGEAYSSTWFLLGYRGEIYHVEDDYQVGVSAGGYDAEGCGYDLAMGALCALEGVEMKDRDRVRAALRAAAQFSAGVVAPFHIVEGGAR